MNRPITPGLRDDSGPHSPLEHVDEPLVIDVNERVKSARSKSRPITAAVVEYTSRIVTEAGDTLADDLAHTRRQMAEIKAMPWGPNGRVRLG